MIPKGGGKDFRGIGLVDIPWKDTTGTINRRLTAAILYHDTLHGLQTGHGTGTSTLEAKLIQQLMSMREVVLHTKFLDLQKAYDAMERYR